MCDSDYEIYFESLQTFENTGSGGRIRNFDLRLWAQWAIELVWSNCFSLSGLTISYDTFRQGWEVIEKRDGYEVAFRWFSSRKKAEAFGL